MFDLLPYISYCLLEGEISNNFKDDISLGDFHLEGEFLRTWRVPRSDKGHHDASLLHY